MSTSLTRSEAVARFLLANAVRVDDGEAFSLDFPPKHSTLIEARFTDLTAKELDRGEDLAMRQMLLHVAVRSTAGALMLAWPSYHEWKRDNDWEPVATASLLVNLKAIDLRAFSPRRRRRSPT